MSEQLREYNDENSCAACGVHISEGHLPHCVLSDESAEYDWQPPIEVYVRCNEAAEAGHSYGLWVDFTQDRQELQEALDYFLSRSPVEGSTELFWDDYSGFYGLESELGMFASVDVLHAVARAIEAKGEPMAHWLRCVGATAEDIESQAAKFDQHYLGQFDSRHSFADWFIGQTDAEPVEDMERFTAELTEPLEIFPSEDGQSYYFFDPR